MVFGFDRSVAPLLEGVEAGVDPRVRLEQVVADALRQPPCVVTFSGGRDSSAMLAVAALVARREGLPLPVPVTLRIAGSIEADESQWQELVLKHLRLDDWVKITVGGELDVVGPIATEAMTRHGLLWPFNTHFHIPMFEQARGGSVITGSGGDELGMSTSTARAERIVRSRRIRSLADLEIVGLALAPRPVRSAVLARRERVELRPRTWLTDDGRRKVARASARMAAQIPFGWDKVVREGIWRARYFRLAISCFDSVAATYQTRPVHPLFDPQVLASLAQAGGFAGLGDRTDLMKRLFGDLLPDQTVSRSTKATFDEVLWSDHSRRFAEQWSGRGIPEALVEPESLRRNWLSTQPHATTATLMQAAWLHDRGSSAEAG
jgi:asparagine synthase (glutamine-hydrolysing)